MTLSKQKPLFDMNTDGGTNEENKSREYITISPGNIFLLFFIMFLFIASGTLKFPFSILPAMIAAPLYAIFSYKIGNRFSFLPPIIAFFISIIASRSVSSAITSLLAAGMAFAILSAINKNPEKAKTSAVIRCTVAFVVYLAAQITVYVVANDISSSASFAAAINRYFDSAKELMLSIYSAGFEEIAANYDISKLTGVEAPSFEMITAYVDMMMYQAKAMLPATVSLWMMGVSYVSCSLLLPLTKLLGARNMLEGKIFSITISGICLAVYFIASLGMVFAKGPEVYGFRNIVSIISPCFMLCGIKQIGELLKTKLPHGVILFVKFASIVAALILGNIGTTVLTVMGMYYATRKSAANRYQ